MKENYLSITKNLAKFTFEVVKNVIDISPSNETKLLLSKEEQKESCERGEGIAEKRWKRGDLEEWAKSGQRVGMWIVEEVCEEQLEGGGKE